MRRHGLILERGAKLGGHTVVVERISGGKFVPIAAGDAVAPNETFRVHAALPITHGRDAQLVVYDQGQNVVLDQRKFASVFSQDVLFVLALVREGAYTIQVSAGTFAEHEVQTTLLVSSTASKPPAAPPSTGLPGVVEDLERFTKTAGFIILGIVGFMVVNNLVKRS